MIDKLESMAERLKELEKQIADPEVIRDQKKYKTLMQEHSHLAVIGETYNEYKTILSDLEGSKEIIESESDPEMLAMAREEASELEKKQEKLESQLKLLLVPKDPLDDKNIIVEIRAGTGGEEAALFAANLYRMYSRFAENNKWKIEILDISETGIGGIKEIIFSVQGKGAYGKLRYESGGHRVQRVPETESGGRIHTSACTVAVLPEAEETDIEINTEDLRIDTFRSSGAGGQHVNTTDSAIRITHLPTGLVVSCQDEKSQHKNKAKALRVLRARLFEQEEARKAKERAEERKSQIGSGDRSERIRTYNFPQNRVTDHRINLTLYKLESFMEGEIDEMLESIRLHVNQEQLSQ